GLAVVHAEVVAAQLPRDQPPRAGRAAAHVQHRHARADAGLCRQRADLAGGHEALLPGELARGVRRHPRPPQCPLERGTLVLPHEPKASRKRSRNEAIGHTGACGLGSRPSCQPQPAIWSSTFGSWATIDTGTSCVASWPLTNVAGWWSPRNSTTV